MKIYLLPFILVALCVFGGLVLTTSNIHAASTTFSLESVDLGLGGADLKQTTLNIVRWVLGLLSLVAVVMIIASVFVAATSGDSEAAEKAKKTIAGAVIGLVIVLMAWAIVLFVTRTTNNVTVNS